MAFLCPVRIRRDKKKATNANIERDLPIPGVGLGRITGSSSIETLVRVGIEKEHGLSPDSKMVVLHDFTPCVDDELEVKRGQVVNVLYRENDWVYVIGQDTRQEGFIPYSYCAAYNTQLADLAIKKKLPRDQNVNSTDMENALLLGIDNKIDFVDDVGGSSGGGSISLKNSVMSVFSEADHSTFHKESSGRYIMLYTFVARDENDLSVERGEFVTVLNRDDSDWFWIMRSDGQEGFIPSTFVFPADSVLQTQRKLLNACNMVTGGQETTGGNGTAGIHHEVRLGSSEFSTAMAVALNSLGQPLASSNQMDVCVTNLQQQQSQISIGQDDLRYHGSELVMLYDYHKAQAPDDLSVRRGDWVYADLNNQTVDGWLWAYAPKTRKYGFIPKAYARPPAMTSL